MTKISLFLFSLFFLSVFCLFPVQASAQGFSVSPSSFDLEVPFDGKTSVTVYITYDGFEGSLNVGLKNIPLKVEPTTISIDRYDVNKPVELIFYGDVLTEPKTYSGNVTIIGTEGGEVGATYVAEVEVNIALLGPAQTHDGQVTLTGTPEAEYTVTTGGVFDLEYVVAFKTEVAGETCEAGINIAYPMHVAYEGYTADVDGGQVTFDVDTTPMIGTLRARLGPNTVPTGTLTIVVSLTTLKEGNYSDPLHISYAFLTRDSEGNIVDAKVGGNDVLINVQAPTPTPQGEENDLVSQVAWIVAGGVIIAAILLLAGKK